MISLGRWRWPLILTLPICGVAGLVWHGEVRPVFESGVTLNWAQKAPLPSDEFNRLTSEQVRQRAAATSGFALAKLRARRVPGHPNEVVLTNEGQWPQAARAMSEAAARAVMADQTARQKAGIHEKMAAVDKQMADFASRLNAIEKDYQAARQPIRVASFQPAPAMLNQLQGMKTRRQLLMERFPTHPDIPKLALQIQKLEAQRRSRPSAKPDNVLQNKLGRARAEIQIQMDVLNLQRLALAGTEKGLRPSWSLRPAAREGVRPRRIDGWPVGAGVFMGLFLVGFLGTRGTRKATTVPFTNGLWKASSTIPLAVAASGNGHALETPPWQVPDDPFSKEAASLYDQWLALVEKLYEPAVAPPKGIMESFDPLLQKTFQLIHTGQDALSKCLARTIRPGELTSHVAHTVLMAIMGTLEAGASPEHGRAMALAALFHDLAIVPRPVIALQDVGSEVGRLSASIVPKIPGIAPALTAMIQEILIGMDDFKEAMWQNLSTGGNLRPLANLLRQVDRFEKVMQKQSLRIQRRLPHPAAAV